MSFEAKNALHLTQIGVCSIMHVIDSERKK
jgi:hypothetical protein